MVCIYCDSATSVVNSRQQKQNNNIWRRRLCDSCKARFTTIEQADLESAFMVSGKDGPHSFHRDRLLLSIYESCKHRPNAINEASFLTDLVINKLIAQKKGGSPVISQQEIVTKTKETLSNFDKTTETLYAAYHPAHK